jgi:2-oxoglutarate ferredoxin oxidoreductase subunit alpha
VFLLADEVVGHMVERVVIPPAEQIEHWERKRPKTPPNGRFDPFRALDDDLVPPMAHAGEGYRVHFTGLTHDEHGYPDMSAETHHKLVSRLIDKVRRNAPQIIRTEEYYLDEADIVVIAYGCTARSARRAMRDARQEGIPVGMLRLVSLWPFPEDTIRELSGSVDAFIVAEMNLGQISREVERSVAQPVQGVFHAGGAMIPPEPILEAIRKAAKKI